jgi:hypothetical protein
MRRARDLVGFCALYEFEDVVAAITGADRVDVGDYGAVERARRLYKLRRLATRSRRLAAAVPSRLGVRLARDYELFFPAFNDPFELFALCTVPDWRSRCRIAACFVSEMWVHDLPEYLLELLSDFDHVFVGLQHSVADVARIVGKPCTYLPMGVDVLRFAPYPSPPPRTIDVCNVGRHSMVTHAALMRRARERRTFYYHDTVLASGEDGKQTTFRVRSAEEHRLLLANILQRSRYYIANRAKVNQPECREREEISARFYEGIAAGAVLVGEAPRSPEFRRQFDWPGAVVHLPYDSPDAGDVLARLDSDPVYVDGVRRENVRQAALRHDWLHRLQIVFDAIGLTPTEAMRARAGRLREISEAAGHAAAPVG